MSAATLRARSLALDTGSHLGARPTSPPCGKLAQHTPVAQRTRRRTSIKSKEFESRRGCCDAGARSLQTFAIMRVAVGRPQYTRIELATFSVLGRVCNGGCGPYIRTTMQDSAHGR